MRPARRVGGHVRARWKTAAVAAVVVLAVTAAFLYSAGGPGRIPPSTIDFAALSASDRAAWVERGRYIAQAADCEACHRADDGNPLAGGTAMQTPFGTLYGTNITASRTHGIGEWTADDLYRSLVWGFDRDGRALYPAMPYTSYHRITREDSDALWLFLQSTPPIDRPDPPQQLTFPFNIRPAIRFWNALFRPGESGLARPAGTAAAGAATAGTVPAGVPAGTAAAGAAPAATVTAATTAAAEPPEGRGRYLVDVLGHCGECHTPRNLAFAMKTDRALQGEVIEHAVAPDITARGLAGRGWTGSDLQQFFSHGLAPQGVMAFRMFPVLRHSTRHLTDADVRAMTAHLVGTEPMPGPVPRAPTAGLDAPVAADGRRLYLGLCAGCHGTDGEGMPHSAVRMDVNTSAQLADPLNLVRVILEGVEERDLAHGERMQQMPAYADALDDGQLAALATWLRRRWGGQEREVSADDVRRIRAGK